MHLQEERGQIDQDEADWDEEDRYSGVIREKRWEWVHCFHIDMLKSAVIVNFIFPPQSLSQQLWK